MLDADFQQSHRAGMVTSAWGFRLGWDERKDDQRQPRVIAGLDHVLLMMYALQHFRVLVGVAMGRSALLGTYRLRLLVGVSLLAVGGGLAAPAQACTSVSDTTISVSTGCVSWTGGNLSLTNTGTISNAGTALGTGASVGTLVNSGRVSGTSRGIYNDTGTIGMLINSGTIAGIVGGDTPIGIFNTGRIGTLINNSGSYISGAQSGVYNSNIGSGIGTLSNSGVISGGGSGNGIWSLGTISDLDNASGGTISGQAGIKINASIGTLTNEGTISGTDTGILIGNGGGIGTLTNTGAISGSNYAIYTSRSIGPITNSGVISGNINNLSASNLTINGGSGTTFGTLTGGTISNTASNLVFSSGNILLQDGVKLVGSAPEEIPENAIPTVHSLLNTGAMVMLTPAFTPTITGIYNQTGGGLAIVAANNGSSYGFVNVTGNATVANSSVTISGAGLTAGETFTIVRSGATGSYTNDTATVTGTNGLTASISTVANGLVVTLTGSATITSTITNSNTITNSGYYVIGAPTSNAGGDMGHALDALVASGSVSPAFQSGVLNVINALPADQKGSAISQLAPTKNAPVAQMTNNAATAVLGAVEQHQQTAMAYDPATGTAAGSETYDSALWGQLLGGGAVRGSNAEADGYKITDTGLASGVDHLFTENAMGGVAFSWIRAWTGGAGNSAGSSSKLDSYQLTFYGTYRQGPAFVDGQLGAGYNSFSQKRGIGFLNSTASADYGGEQYLARALAGYDLPMGGITVTPLAGLTWLRAVNDAYSENGAGAADLNIDRRGINSLSHDLGGKLSWSLPTSLGVVKPEVRMEWVHDYTRAPIATSGLIGGETFATTTTRIAPDGVQWGLAATLNSDDALSFRAEYQGEARTKYQSHTAMVKAVWGF